MDSYEVELRAEELRAEYARVGGSSDSAFFAELLFTAAESMIRVGASAELGEFSESSCDGSFDIGRGF